MVTFKKYMSMSENEKCTQQRVSRVNVMVSDRDTALNKYLWSAGIIKVPKVKDH